MQSPVPVPSFTLPIHLRRPQPVLLLDVSASMSTGEPKRITLLWTAVQALRSPPMTWKTAIFNDDCRWLTQERQPTPEGMTNLAGAFDYIRQIKPTVVTLVTDGEPNDMDAAQTRGLALGCPVSILFVGDPQLEEAISFCRRLCQSTGGTFATEVLTLTSGAAVVSTLRRMLGTGAPAKAAIVMGEHP